jgi:RimJ/RimL family protein N-acetyltransferase
VARVETERLLLRRLEHADRDAYYERIYADPAVMRTLPAQRPLTRAEFDARMPAVMVDHWEEHGFGPWAVVHRADGELIGHCGLRYWPDTPDVEVLYALDRRYWGRGLASEGARASLRFGFQRLGLERIIAAAMVTNIASRRVLEKLGMRYERDEPFRGLDAAWYAIRRDEWSPADEPWRVVP